MLIASLQKDKTTSNECPEYETNPSDSVVPVLEHWGIWSSALLPLHPGTF